MNTESVDYFTSYEDFEVHRLMLDDFPRTNSYRQAIFNNRNYFKDKIVLDVGCGTGILSLFCAQAGAKTVYAVEASNLAHIANEIIKENNFEDVIQVIHSKVEDITLPEGVKVDVIVSEWMGFYLLHEGMLDSVLFARDKFLKEGGEMFPESALIYAAPCSLPALYNKWEDVHGVKMTCFGKHLRKSKQHKPEIATINRDDIIGAEDAVYWIDLKSTTVEDLNFITGQRVVAASKSGLYQGICVWFTCTFPDLSEEDGSSQVILETGPFNEETHWKQTIIVLPQEQNVEENEPIAFQLDMKRDTSNNRRYTLEVTLLDPEEVEHPVPCSCHMTKCIVINAFLHQHPDKEEKDNILQECQVGDR